MKQMQDLATPHNTPKLFAFERCVV